MVCRNRQVGARRQPHQVVRVRHRVSLVKVIHTPDQPPLLIAPGAEIFHVQVAHGQHPRSSCQVGTDLKPYLHPAVEGGAQKLKRILGHAGVLQRQIGRNYR